MTWKGDTFLGLNVKREENCQWHIPTCPAKYPYLNSLEDFIGYPRMAAMTLPDRGRPRLQVTMAGKFANGLIDSGADISGVDSRLAETLTDKNECITLPGKYDSIIDIQGKALNIVGLKLVRVRSAGADSLDTWFPFYVIKDLGDPVVLGWDLQVHIGLTINAAKGTVEIEFPKGRHKMHPHIIQAMIASATPAPEEPAWQARLQPTSNTHIGTGKSKVIKCTIQVHGDLVIKPGATVLVDQLNDNSDSRLTVRPGLYKARENNQVLVIMDNMEHHDVFTTSAGPLQAVRVQSVEGLAIAPADPSFIAAIAKQGDTSIKQKPSQPMSKEKAEFVYSSLQLQEIEKEFRHLYHNWVAENHDIFSRDEFELGEAAVLKHKIVPKSNKPIFVKQFRIPQEGQQFVEDFVDRGLVQGIVEEARSVHNSPIFVVAKPSGGLRIVQDLRAINEGTLDDQYSIADTKSCIDQIGQNGSGVFSALDLTSAFWQLPLDESSRDFTAFTLYSRNMQYRWKRTCMGLKGAPSSFARLMGLVFKGQKGVITYVDDALAHAKDHIEMIARLEEVAHRLRQHNLKLNPKKTLLGRSEVKYLGFDISKDGVRPARDKLEAIKILQPPRDPKQVKELLGLCQFFCRMIPNYSVLAAPLQDLTKKSCTWEGGPLPKKALEAFYKLKQALMAEPLMAYPLKGKPYNLAVDACRGDNENPGGLGAILSQHQQHNGVMEDRVIAYWSRRLRENEADNSAFSLERKAMVEALEVFHHYCYGNKTIIYCDHKPLVEYAKKESQLISRLHEKLNTYNHEIIYRKGKLNPADCLSRQTAPIAQMAALTRKEAQTSDHFCKMIKAALNKEPIMGDKLSKDIILHNISRFAVIDDLIWYMEDKKARARLVAPKSMIPDILQQAHGPPTVGHWGVARTLQLAANDFYWPSMAADVAAWCNACKVCIMARSSNSKESLAPWPQATDFNQRVHLDLCGPFKSYSPNKFIAVFSDAFSKFVMVTAIPNKTAETIAEMYYRTWLATFGPCQLLVTDNGGEFNNELLIELCKRTGTMKHTICPFHPQANGQVERVNAELKSFLTAQATSTLDWEPWLPAFMCAHNGAISRATNETPYMLVFGRQPRRPTTQVKPEVMYAPNAAKEHATRLFEATEAAKTRNEEVRQKYKADFDKKSRQKILKEGDRVAVFFPPPPGSNPKLHKPYREGFIVDGILPNHVVRLFNVKTKKTVNFHKNRVKLIPQLPPELAQNPSRTYPIVTEEAQANWESVKEEIESLKEPELESPNRRDSTLQGTEWRAIVSEEKTNSEPQRAINNSPGGSESSKEIQKFYDHASSAVPSDKLFKGPITRARQRAIIQKEWPTPQQAARVKQQKHSYLNAQHMNTREFVNTLLLCEELDNAEERDPSPGQLIGRRGSQEELEERIQESLTITRSASQLEPFKRLRRNGNIEHQGRENFGKKIGTHATTTGGSGEKEEIERRQSQDHGKATVETGTIHGQRVGDLQDSVKDTRGGEGSGPKVRRHHRRSHEMHGNDGIFSRLRSKVSKGTPGQDGQRIGEAGSNEHEIDRAGEEEEDGQFGLFSTSFEQSFGQEHLGDDSKDGSWRLELNITSVSDSEEESFLRDLRGLDGSRDGNGRRGIDDFKTPKGKVSGKRPREEEEFISADDRTPSPKRPPARKHRQGEEGGALKFRKFFRP